MTEISITLPEDVVQYMDEDPYIGDRGKFIAMLIRRWQREVENSRRKAEADENNPDIVSLESACLDAMHNLNVDITLES